MKSLKPKISFFMLIGLLMLTVVGCSAQGSTNDTSTEKNSDTEDSSSEEMKKKDGGKVVVSVPQDIDYLDPHLSAASGTYEIMYNVFEGLLKPNEQGEVIPAIADDYSISEDGLTYTFILRKDVTFHNGEPVTTDDVKYSMERLMGVDTGKPLAESFTNIESVEASDEKTVVIKLKDVDSSFLTQMTVAILPKGYDKHNEHPIGAGPFKFVEYSPEQKIVLEKNEDYYVEGIPYLDEVEFRIIPDSEAALLSFKAGEIDMYPRIGNERIEELGDEFNYIQGDQNMVQLMTMNHEREPFNDRTVRKAINYTIDVNEIIETAAFGFGTKLGSNMSPAMEKYYQSGLEDTYNVDIKKSKQLLEEGGYPDGFETTISVPSNYQFHVDTAQVIAQQLEQVGIKANIELVEWGVWLDRIYKGRDYDMTIIGLTGKLDPHKVLGRYESTYAANFYNYNNEEYDEIIQQAKKETDDEKRVNLYKEAQEILTNDAVAVYIMDPNFSVAMRSDLAGYKLYPLYVQDMSSIHYVE
ncbi:ABC transporter substrate-binding protein [Pontibacillus litoralis]|uniref:ABC transporter substrate-binding protein n=1 Tax=Pontibacillus litoralis JSM 072002 TaxID=1385512 RepID=A0A0A5G698_9BACI|nr:ABC transporter substrate-binding protein [Pontibacillus litoralis]KGX86615.1 ABC transporter substrate-binding protein [Pontibacillus litoralis JSM 072002]